MYCISNVIEYIMMEVWQNIPINAYSVTLVFNGISIMRYLKTPALECIFRDTWSWSIFIDTSSTHNKFLWQNVLLWHFWQTFVCRIVSVWQTRPFDSAKNYLFVALNQCDEGINGLAAKRVKNTLFVTEHATRRIQSSILNVCVSVPSSTRSSANSACYH